jgi:hypothetical protein
MQASTHKSLFFSVIRLIEHYHYCRRKEKKKKGGGTTDEETQNEGGGKGLFVSPIVMRIFPRKKIILADNRIL